jgi:branched-chain amino acid transport system permease protein
MTLLRHLATAVRAGVTMTLLRHLAIAVGAAIVLLAAAHQLSPFRQFQLAEVAAYLVAVAGLTVLVGASGQISLGNGAFMAIGGYATALVLLHLQWPLAAVLAISAVAAAAVGTVVGVAAARLRGPYLAGATLMLAVALPSLASRFAGELGGDQGLTVTIITPPWLGITFPPSEWLAWIACAAALITLVLLANVMRSRIGRGWRALRDDEVAAALAGLNVARLRVLAFIISAACAGLGGALLAITAGIASPGEFTLTLSITLLAGAVLGGLGSLAGALWGSLVLIFLPTYLTDVANSHGLSSGASSNVPIAVYGVVLIVVMLVFPSGIQGMVRRFLGLPGSGGPATPGSRAAGSRLTALRERTGAARRHAEPPGKPAVTPQEPAAAGSPQHPPASSHHEEGTT